MLKINHYFKKLTREELEHLDLTNQQNARRKQEMKDKAQEVTNSVVEFINIIDEGDEENSDLPVGDAVRNAFDQLMADELDPKVVTSTIKLKKKDKRKKKKKDLTIGRKL